MVIINNIDVEKWNVGDKNITPFILLILRIYVVICTW